MKSRNQRIYNDDQLLLERIYEDFVFMGRDVDIAPGVVTVYAVDRKLKKSKSQAALTVGSARNKRAEKHKDD